MANQNVKRIKITLNGEDKFIPQKTSLKNLLDELELDEKKIAIEKNYEIILPENFAEDFLSEGDRVEVVCFIGGG